MRFFSNVLLDPISIDRVLNDSNYEEEKGLINYHSITSRFNLIRTIFKLLSVYAIDGYRLNNRCAFDIRYQMKFLMLLNFRY